jgi:hypothetical protein
MKYDDSTCLSWKEILSQIDDYYQVNLFLDENNTLIFENFILPKSLYYSYIRFVEYKNNASGRRGRMATRLWKLTARRPIYSCYISARMMHACKQEQSKAMLIHLHA